MPGTVLGTVDSAVRETDVVLDPERRQPSDACQA